MLGFVIGTLCLFGLFHALRRAHYAYDGPFGFQARPLLGGCGYSPWRRRGRRFRSGRRRFALRWLFERLDATPGQEKVIMKNLETLQQHASDGRGELAQVRREVADALGADVLDQAQLTAALGRVETLLAKTKDELLRALSEVHAALEGPQRKELAELIAHGPFADRERDPDWQ